MNFDLPESPDCPICCCCDEPAAARCHRCGEFYCGECFGPGRADEGEPCRDCAKKPTPPEPLVPAPMLIIYTEPRTAFGAEKSGDGRV
jgi:hypothetical protein